MERKPNQSLSRTASLTGKKAESTANLTLAYQRIFALEDLGSVGKNVGGVDLARKVCG